MSVSLGTVTREQLGLVGLAIRRETLAAAFLFVVPMVALLLLMLSGYAELLEDGAPLLDLDPEGAGYFAAIIGLMFPLLVWKGEERFGDTPLWTLPVDHRRHALFKVSAGWAWLMGIGAATLGWLILISVATGGSVGGEEVRLLITDPAGAATGLPGSTEPIVWSTAWWQWAILFTSATAAYLVSSALLLATERPWWWAVGAWFVFLGVAVLGEEVHIPWVSPAFWYVFRSVIWMIDVPLSGGEELLRTVVSLPGGDRAIAWSAMPNPGTWAAATLLWFFIGGAALWLTAGRRRPA